MTAPVIRPPRSSIVSPPVVAGRNIRVTFGDNIALDGVDLTVRPGEVVGLLGHSGSGKSTLMKTLTRLTDFTADELTVAGRDVAQQNGSDLRSLRSDVGYVFQHFNLVPRLSALTNVLTGGLYDAGAVNLIGGFGRTQRVEALELLRRVGLEGKASQQSRTLSGGEQQRVAIARTLMQHPKLILADEPVASLDPRLAGTILTLLREIARERQVPVIVSLHVVGLARKYTDRVIGLRDGRTVFNSRAEELNEEAVSTIYGEHADIVEQ